MYICIGPTFAPMLKDKNVRPTCILCVTQVRWLHVCVPNLFSKILL